MLDGRLQKLIEKPVPKQALLTESLQQALAAPHPATGAPPFGARSMHSGDEPPPSWCAPNVAIVDALVGTSARTAWTLCTKL